MDSGKLIHRVTIETLEEIRSPTGAVKKTWLPIAKNIAARVTPLSAREFFSSAQTQVNATARVLIRYRDNINETMRIIHRNKVYLITGMLEDNETGLSHLTLLVQWDREASTELKEA